MSRKLHPRSVARGRAFQVLYSLHFSPATTLHSLRVAFNDVPDPTDADMDEARAMEEPQKNGRKKSDPAPVEAPPAPPSGFAWELVEGVWGKTAELDALITRFSQNWRLDRLGKIELTLLRLAMFELFFRTDIPPKVAINEALELSSRFGDAKAKSFINGILDAAAKTLPPATEEPGHTA